MRRTRSSFPASRSSSQRAAVLRSCHTMARWRGAPVRRSHTTAVSRWLVMPIAATGRSSSARRSAIVACTASQISTGSCSTHPGSGKCCVNSRYFHPHGVPESSTANARTPVVPASMAMTTALPAMLGCEATARGPLVSEAPSASRRHRAWSKRSITSAPPRLSRARARSSHDGRGGAGSRSGSAAAMPSTSACTSPGASRTANRKVPVHWSACQRLSTTRPRSG